MTGEERRATVLRRVIVRYRTPADKRRITKRLRVRAKYADGFVLTWNEAIDLSHDHGVIEVWIRRPGLW
jgi:hypothetical protein